MRSKGGQEQKKISLETFVQIVTRSQWPLIFHSRL